MTRSRFGRACWASLLAVAAAAIVAAPAGAKTRTHSSGPINAPIPEPSYPLGVPGSTVGTAADTIRVNTRGKIKDVDVALRISHTYDADLEVWLMSPAGAIVKLVLRRGADGDNFGQDSLGCGGSFTVLDDEASLPIGSGVAPLAGSFRPDQPLSRLNGGRAKGSWTLLVLDAGQGDTGVLHCWELTIASKARRK
jgi:subtilisin-like proprotein convertase family protein